MGRMEQKERNKWKAYTVWVGLGTSSVIIMKSYGTLRKDMGAEISEKKKENTYTFVDWLRHCANRYDARVARRNANLRD